MKLLTSLVASLGILLGFRSAAFAASSQNLIERYLDITLGSGPCAAGDVPQITGIFCIIAKSINLLLGLVGGVALAMLLYGGLIYMISGGDQKQLTTAKSILTYAVLGLLIVLGAILAIDTLLFGLLDLK